MGNLDKIPLFFDLPFPGSHDVHHPSSPPYPCGHHEPPPPMDCYRSPPHEGRINPWVECPASPYDDPCHPSFLPTQHQALIQDLLLLLSDPMVPASLTSPICVIFHNLLSILSSPSHHEPPPLTDHYCSPPHEGRINP